jgi:DNA-binding transcriptional LysR family regulator
MDKIKAMRAFVRIVEANSFSKAAETLDVPRAALTATIQKLEAALGVQLLQRTGGVALQGARCRQSARAPARRAAGDPGQECHPAAAGNVSRAVSRP